MTASRLGLLLALVLCTPSPVHGELDRSSSREFALPLPEMEHIISRWFSQSGLRVSRTLPEPGRIDLSARREGESWEVALKTRSPLATEVSAVCLINGQPDEARREGLWVYLAQYLRALSTAEENASEEAPEAVVSKRRSVVCIKAAVEGGYLQFSGFLIDRKGLVLATAHDLQGALEITVTLSDGRAFKGRLLKMDLEWDLALIAVKAEVKSIISPDQGRSALNEGERLYSVGCPGNMNGTVHAAFLSGPPRRINNAPLLQVVMKTLPGGSGSPVFDREGNLVAMVRGRYRGTDMVGFLTPLEIMRRFLCER
jgi:serine protease Do